MQQTIKLQSLGIGELRTYTYATLFTVGNIVLPQLCHLIPQGGLMILPIYFFTLIGAYKYGLTVGLLTAVLSPLTNSLLFGMPVVGMLPAILIKSVLLALGAALTARHFNKVSILLLAAVVLFYQVVGSVAEWAVTGTLTAALQDFRLSVPGMLLQVFGGYVVLTKIIRK